MVSSVWRRIRALTRELGIASALLYLLDRLLRQTSSRSGFSYYIFVAQPLADRPRLPPSRGNAFSFRVLEGLDALLESLDRPEEVIRARFLQGAKCLGAIKNERLVGCIWFVRGQYAEDEVRVDYVLPGDCGCVWDFDVFVAEPERLGFLFAKQWDAFDALLKPQGINHTVSRINAFNQRSIASHGSLGAREIGRALFVRLGRFQWMVSNLRPFFALGGRPKLYMRLNATTKSLS